MNGMATESPTMKTDLETPIRNHYHYRQLLDVYHFELETDYFNAKRRLINRLVCGYGVVCGLDVQSGPKDDTIIITPGVAIDKWGREIIVPTTTDPIVIPADLLPPPAGYVKPDNQYGQAEQYGQLEQHGQHEKRRPRYGEEEKEETWIKVMLCYHECESDPVPVLSGDCGGTEVCVAGAIREQYRITFREGRSKQVNTECAIPDFVPRERIDYPSIVRWVTDGCAEMPRNPCITLANIRVSDSGHQCDADNIDINVRPIVYSNDLLYNLILSLLTEQQGRHEK